MPKESTWPTSLRLTTRTPFGGHKINMAELIELTNERPLKSLNADLNEERSKLIELVISSSQTDS